MLVSVDSAVTVLALLVAAWAGYKLVTVVRARLAVRDSASGDASDGVGAGGTTTDRVTDGERLTVEGDVFVTEPATAADRVAADSSGDVGAYVWLAGYSDEGIVYDSDRGTFRGARSWFASGVEAGEFGVIVDGRRVSVDLSWLRETHDAPELSSLEIGDTRSNISYPRVFARYAWDSLCLSLESAVGECSVDRLRDVVARYDPSGHSYFLAWRAITTDQRLFVSGEVRADGDRLTLCGTDETPLFVSDGGVDGIVSRLRRRAARYGVVFFAAAGVVVVDVASLL